MPPRMVQQPHGAPVPAPGGLPGLIVRVGPAGGDAAQAHLAAGHHPDDLIEAAANSLAMAAMVNGRLDPARYQAWVNARVQFLTHIPGAAELFGTVAAAQHTLQAVTARSGVAGGQAPQPASAPPAVPFAVQHGDLSPVAPAASFAPRSNPLISR